MASAAANQQSDFTLMAVLAAPVMLFVLVYFGYALAVWRQRPGDETDGPPLHGNVRAQASFIGISSVIVLFLAVFGTVELISTQGAGAGQGPNPIWKPAAAGQGTRSGALQVQVIGQQWKFTYRYPQFGGFETTQLVLPEGQWVEFHVTSIDVIHSFWAYQLGVKADANPGVDNVAFTRPRAPRPVPGALRRAVRAVARGDVQRRRGRPGGRLPALGRRHQDPARRRDPDPAAVRPDL